MSEERRYNCDGSRRWILSPIMRYIPSDDEQREKETPPRPIPRGLARSTLPRLRFLRRIDEHCARRAHLRQGKEGEVGEEANGVARQAASPSRQQMASNTPGARMPLAARPCRCPKNPWIDGSSYASSSPPSLQDSRDTTSTPYRSRNESCRPARSSRRRILRRDDCPSGTPGLHTPQRWVPRPTKTRPQDVSCEVP